MILASKVAAGILAFAEGDHILPLFSARPHPAISAATTTVPACTRPLPSLFQSVQWVNKGF